MGLGKNFDPFSQPSHNVLVFTDIFNHLRLITQFRIVLEPLDQLIMVSQRNPQQVMKARLTILSLKTRSNKLKRMRNISQLLLLRFYQIYSRFNLPMNVIIIRRIQIPPQHIFPIEHQSQKLA